MAGSLVAYDASSDSDTEELQSPLTAKAMMAMTSRINASPALQSKGFVNHIVPVDPSAKQLTYNPRYEDLYAPEAGPINPFRTPGSLIKKNTLAGFAELAHISDYHFEAERRTFHTFGFAHDPTEDADPKRLIGTVATKQIQLEDEADPKIGSGGDKASASSIRKKQKRLRNDEAGDIEGFQGPWAPLAGERRNVKPTPEEQEELNAILAKRHKHSNKQTDEAAADEKSTLHIDEPLDYQGRSFLVAPTHVDGEKLRSPEKCFLPKKLLHQWAGHTKGTACVKLFPDSGHLLLSAGMDSKVKLWRFYDDRALVRSYAGHKQAVRDVDFSYDGTSFLSTAYDRYVKLWDTETGQVRERFTCRKVAYCVKFKPDSQDLFLAGTSDKKIICWDARSNSIVQEYDRHLGAVNTITFIEDGQKFVTTSDDKSVRVWEWDIPVDVKYIADPAMHSMPAVTLSPNRKWLACQSMDNKIVIFSALNRLKMNRKKEFKGHMVAGYACGLDFSPDHAYLVSGDADGNMALFDWKSTRMLQKVKAHDAVCISTLWHPMDTSKVITAGWDGAIKLWD
ncbi:pre-mRNA-processing factor 17-like [Tropilaelaps mercedesae]|uniref:Pre-mRNA-processing factor 17 n=1 Tax=Tropilaelaps mercedesae TaxID=418985 RepID=A0A1V9XKA7_9ACAR|nr:pre-mRNA-processing factor 17-like [Tropilaelaps mercedesae]